jgi:ligand-binding SRPBCC domain-containing protein
MAEFETTVTVQCSIDRAFDFLLRPANAQKVSPPTVGLQFISAPEIVEVGSRLEFKIQAYGQVQKFVHEIIQVDRPDKIVEKQVQGLFSKWVHAHEFSTSASGETTIIDRIEFEPPSGLLGFLLTRKRILEELEDGYFHRHKQLRKLLESEERL